MFKYIPPDEDCETLEDYKPDGYHPVIIGNTLHDGRYTIVHKLGFGGFATVWLCRDSLEDRCVAIKILVGSRSEDRTELQVYQKLEKSMTQMNAKAHIARLLDHFEIIGPNGKHTCLVLPVLGRSLQSLSQNVPPKKLKPSIIRDLAMQQLQAVQQVHDAGIVLGDISPSNVLFETSNLDKASVEEVHAAFGEPRGDEVRRLDGEDVDQGVPDMWYESLDFSRGDDFLLPSVSVIDFGEATLPEQQDLDIPRAMKWCYAAPELLLHNERSMQSDIWALACCWFEVRVGRQLFTQDGGQRSHSILQEIVSTIGELPSELQEAWKGKLAGAGATSEAIDAAINSVDAGGSSLDSKAHSAGQRTRWDQWSVEQRKEAIIRTEYHNGHSLTSADWEYIEGQANRGPPPPGPMSTEEHEDFVDLLTSMLQYGQAARPSLHKISQHVWFTKQYDDDWDCGERWICTYDTGRSTWED